jgi:hypothetical protein
MTIYLVIFIFGGMALATIVEKLLDRHEYHPRNRMVKTMKRRKQ